MGARVRGVGVAEVRGGAGGGLRAAVVSLVIKPLIQCEDRGFFQSTLVNTQSTSSQHPSQHPSQHLLILYYSNRIKQNSFGRLGMLLYN